MGKVGKKREETKGNTAGACPREGGGGHDEEKSKRETKWDSG